MGLLQRRAAQLLRNLRLKLVSRRGSAAYWTHHMVAQPDWTHAEASLEHYSWRNAQYPGYIDLMPVNGADGLVTLDYGCGPGNDLVGFSEYSAPARLIGVDVSQTALRASEKRLALHGKTAELIHIGEDANEIPLDENSVDLVHSSGVLHHVKNLEAALSEIRRILKPGGRLQVMVYNYDSLWLHLYVAFVHQIEKQLYSDLPVTEAFRCSTDGPSCPISHCYRPSEFVDLVERMGFHGRFKGAAISLTELMLLPRRFEAIQKPGLPREHREFLSALKFNAYGHPVINDHVAGIDACYEFIKR